MQLVTEKRCTKCGNIKSLNEYYKSGHRSACKVCENAKEKEYRNNNKEKIAKRDQKYRAANKEKINERRKKYYSKNKEVCNEYSKQYYHDNKEYYAKKNKENMAKPGNADRAKECRKQNWKEGLKRSREYQQKQKRLNTNYAKSSSIRNTIHSALKRHNVVKSGKSEMLLGCKVIDAMNYLESLGYDRAIHDIDHIVPVGRFDMNNEIHRIVAFNYKNMQPLEKFENKSKHDKLLKGWELIIINICKSLNVESIEILNHIEGIIKVA